MLKITQVASKQSLGHESFLSNSEDTISFSKAYKEKVEDTQKSVFYELG